jgi:hypothetical protein
MLESGGRNAGAVVIAALVAATLAGVGVGGCGGGQGSQGAELDAVGGDGPFGAMDGSQHADGAHHDTGGGDTGVSDTALPEAASDVEAGPLPPCPAPTFAPVSGTTEPGNVTISDPNLPPSGTILYTTDGTNPTPASNVYSSPIEVTQDVTFRAQAMDPGVCLPSAVVVASYTVFDGWGDGIPPVTFVQTSQTQPNDFLVTLTDEPGATICYTLDGSTPTCLNGVCTGTSSTYSAASRVSIDGSVTDATTGQVTVTAIACEAGYGDTSFAFQQYTLQAAPPTLSGLVAGDQPYDPGGISPSLRSITRTSGSPPNAPFIAYTTDGSVPSCTTGQKIPNPTTFNTNGAPALPQANGQLAAIACKAGYLPSTVITYAYDFVLNAPSVQGGTFFTVPVVTAGTTAGPATVLDTANAGSGDVLCVTTDGSDPACGTGTATLGACSTAAGTTTKGLPVSPGNATSATTTIRAVACPPVGLKPSAVSSAGFTMQLSPPFLWTPDTSAAGQPGWDATGKASPPGGPMTAFVIPSTYFSSLPFPYGDNSTWVAAQVQVPTASCTEIGAGCAPNRFADYYCWSLAGAPTCGCSGFNKVAAAPTDLVNSANLPQGAGTVGGAALSLVACQNAGSSVVFGPSDVTPVVVSGPGGATAPAISAASANPYTRQATVTVTNQDATVGGSTICWTYANPAIPPACDANAQCTSTATAPCTTGTARCGSFQLPSADDPNGANVFTFLPGSSDGTGVASNAQTGGLPFTGSGPTNSGTRAPGVVQQDGYVLSAIACNASEQPSAAAARTYHFAMAPPDISTAGAYATGTYGNLDVPTSVGAGDVVYLTSGSDFDTQLAGAAASVHYATGSAVDCSSPQVDLQCVTLGGAGCSNLPTQASLVDIWDNRAYQPAQRNGQGQIALVTAPTTGSTWQLSTIACGSAGQAASAPRSVTYDLTAGTPMITTDQDGPRLLGQCGGSGQPACCSATPTLLGGAPSSCVPQPRWESTFNVHVSSPTPGASLCVSTSAKPSCLNGVCQGATNQASPVGLAIQDSPTTVYALGCAPGLPASNPVQFDFDVTTTGAVLVPGSAGSCAPNPILQLSTDPANGASPNTEDIAMGGASPYTCLCYTTDGTSPKRVCDPVNCPNHPPSASAATCVRAQNGSAYAQASLPLSATATVSWSTCSTGFDPTAGSLAFGTTPYRETIHVDGDLSDWDQSAFAAGLSSDDSVVVDVDEIDRPGGNAGTTSADGLFTYDASNLYFGFTASGSTFDGRCCNQVGTTCRHGACYPAATSWMSVYIGDGTAGGATTDLPIDGPGLREATRTLPAGAGARYAFAWQTGSANAPLAYAWNAGSPGSWAAASFPVTVGHSATQQSVEFSVPLASLGLTATSTVTAFGTVIADVGRTASGPGLRSGSAELLAWPGCRSGVGSFVDYWNVSLASCSSPSSQRVGCALSRPGM